MHAAPTSDPSGRDTPGREALPDHASHEDVRGVDIDRVGIKGLSWPITVWDRSNKMQPTVATFDATVTLPASQKGTHMSRFVEVLNGVRGELSLKNLPGVLAEIQRRLGADRAQLDVRFPYFMSRRAPVSGAESLMEYKAAFHATRSGDHFDFVLEVAVPVTTLCPCSKAVSERGAHNQRGIVTVEMRSNDFVWIEDVVEAVEACASSPLFALLKREDEKWVTERAYDNPVFVEDLLREVTVRLRPRATWLRISVENVESIHNHSAWAVVEHGEAPARATDAPRPAPAVAGDAAFGPWLRGQRVARSWSQQELAERIGVSPPHLSKVECGERTLPATAYELLAEALGQDADVLRLRAGVVPASVLARLQADPEGALQWAANRA
jgi:GTP cyclohydrolase I